MRPSMLALALCLSLAGAAPTRAQSAPADRLGEAARLIEAGEPERALALLAKVTAKGKDEARLLLLRSTAELMVGETEAGRRDLARALQLDPSQRQAWLNQAALHLAEEKHDAAFEAFRRAEALEPSAADNHLNIGTVELLRGNQQGATERFQRYLAADPSARGYYLVAANYANAGQAESAAAHLQRAIALDERMRVTARQDPNFVPLLTTPTLAKLMEADPAPPAPDAYVLRHEYKETFDGEASKLLSAVLSAVQLSGEPFDPRVEVAGRWALIWGELRIVVRNTPEGQGQVELSASPDQMPLSTWNRRTDKLLRAIGKQLLLEDRKAASELEDDER